MKLDMFNNPIYEGTFLDQFEDKRLIERIISEAYNGLNPVYVLATENEKRKAENVSEMFYRIEKNIDLRFTQSWRENEYPDLAKLLESLGDDEIVSYARWVAKNAAERLETQSRAIPVHPVAVANMQKKTITDKQANFLRKVLKYTGELPETVFAASELITELKRTKSTSKYQSPN